MKSCQIHGVELVKGTAPVYHGMPAAPPEGYLDASETLFPNSFLFVLGGCVIDEESGPKTDVNYCPACRLAEQSWSARGPEYKWF